MAKINTTCICLELSVHEVNALRHLLSYLAADGEAETDVEQQLLDICDAFRDAGFPVSQRPELEISLLNYKDFRAE